MNQLYQIESRQRARAVVTKEEPIEKMEAIKTAEITEIIETTELMQAKKDIIQTTESRENKEPQHGTETNQATHLFELGLQGRFWAER